MVHDSNLDDAASWLKCSMGQAHKELQNSLGQAVHTSPTTLIHRQQMISILRTRSTTLSKAWDDRFHRVASIEKELSTFFEETSEQKEELEDDALAQLSFQGTYTRPLNAIPWMIAAIALFKIWLVPTMTVFFPIIAWLLPFLLLKFVYTLPISQEQYFTVMKALWSGTLGTELPFDAEGKPVMPSFWNSKSIFQIALFGFSFIQGLIQPIQNAMHLHTTDSLFWGVGKKLIELKRIMHEFHADCEQHNLPFFSSAGAQLFDCLDANDYRRSFIIIKEQPERLRMVLRDLARLEILWRMSQHSLLQPTRFKRNVFQIKDAIDISIQPTEKAVPSSLELGLNGTKTPAHAVITGPNGGGKSSFLRATLQTVLFAHAYGFAPAKETVMPRFVWIASGLQLRDTPGVFSMFETEVLYAARTLENTEWDAPGLVLFDELFHSTNPPDGERTAKIFLERLWGSKNTISIVSTHVFPLIESAPETVMPICCPAAETETGEIQYSYAVEPGVCKVSSVRKVWERFGLVAARSGPDSQNLPVKEK